MITLIRNILLILFFLPFSARCQLNSLDGYWMRTERFDTIILIIRQTNYKKKSNIPELRTGLQRSTNRSYEGVFYYSIKNDSISIIDGYGNTLCKTMDYKITGDQWQISSSNCIYFFSRITKEQFDKLLKLMESNKKTINDSDDLNRINE